MNNYEQVMIGVEDLILDFIEFRKTKREPNYKTQSIYDLDRGWMLSSDEEVFATEIEETINICKDYPLPIEHHCGDCSLDDDTDDNEVKFLHNLISSIPRILKPHVSRVLNEYEYHGSPVYDEYLDRETLAQMVDKVMSYAKNHLDEVDEITVSDNESGTWSKFKLLHSIIEILVLVHLFMVNRKRYKQENMFR